MQIGANARLNLELRHRDEPAANTMGFLGQILGSPGASSFPFFLPPWDSWDGWMRRLGKSGESLGPALFLGRRLGVTRALLGVLGGEREERLTGSGGLASALALGWRRARRKTPNAPNPKLQTPGMRATGDLSAESKGQRLRVKVSGGLGIEGERGSGEGQLGQLQPSMQLEARSSASSTTENSPIGALPGPFQGRSGGLPGGFPAHKRHGDSGRAGLQREREA